MAKLFSLQYLQELSSKILTSIKYHLVIKNLFTNWSQNTEVIELKTVLEVTAGTWNSHLFSRAAGEVLHPCIGYEEVVQKEKEYLTHKTYSLNLFKII